MLAKKRRMNDLQQTLALRREQVARIDKAYRVRTPAPHRPPPIHIEEWFSGEEVETARGKHFEAEKLYERHRRHGSAERGARAERPHDLRDRVSLRSVPDGPPETWAFLDTETTGLAGGSGTCAFLVGVGRITAEGFR